MTEHEASRTLVKSPPELWAECSDAMSLSRHLEQFGELRITRLEPETAVAWEGVQASGTVRLEPSGWGTRVVLTARPEPESPDPAPAEPEAEVRADPPDPGDPPDPDPDPEPDPLPPAAAEPQRLGFLARVRRWFGGPEPVADEREPAPEAAVEPEPEPEPDPGAAPETPEPAAESTSEVAEALTAALDSLGQAHHRPFSRA